MRKYLIMGGLTLQLLFLIGCGTTDSNNDKCYIHGTANSRFEGKKIFLLPLNEPAVAATVDSVVITDGKFEFESEPGKMKVIRIDYLFRTGVEDLLVVTEPGHVQVVIDSVSSGKGTPQNDSLQAWKEYTLMHNKRLIPYRVKEREAREVGDSLVMDAMKVQIDSIEREYKHYSRKIADDIKEGPLHDFLMSRFPTSYKKRTPDGEIVTIELD